MRNYTRIRPRTVYILLEDGTKKYVDLKKSIKPFYECYDRTYYDKKGEKHTFFTNDAECGTRNGWNSFAIYIFVLMLILSIPLLNIALLPTISMISNFSGYKKIEGNISHISIDDNANILNNEQETELINLFHNVYDKTGMPIILYTVKYDYKYKYESPSDYKKKNNYQSEKIYLNNNSEDIFYKVGKNYNLKEGTQVNEPEEKNLKETYYITEEYESLYDYAKEIYNKRIKNEDSMLIIVAADKEDTIRYGLPCIYISRWEYVIYRGDNTVKCISYDEYDKLINEFEKTMAENDKNVTYALKQSWNSIMDEIGELNLQLSNILYISCKIIFNINGIILFYCFYIWLTLSSLDVFLNNKIYEYYKANPDKLSMTLIRYYNYCQHCGAPNKTQSETCLHCGHSLKIEE